MYLLTLFIIIEQLLKCDLIKNQFVIILRQPNDNLRFKRHNTTSCLDLKRTSCNQ